MVRPESERPGRARLVDLTRKETPAAAGPESVAGGLDFERAFPVPAPAPLPEVPAREPGRPMSGARFGAILDHLGWGARAFAAELGWPWASMARQVRRWRSGRDRIPPDVEEWVERLWEAARQRPAHLTAWQRRMYAYRAQREAMERRMNEVLEALEAERPVEEDEAWEVRLEELRALRPPARKDGGGRAMQLEGGAVEVLRNDD